MSVENWSEAVALQYLQTVVVIDDGLLLGTNNSSPNEAELLEPVDALSVEPGEEEGGSVGSVGSEVNTGFSDDLLQGEDLIRGFAEKGLVCGLVKPSNLDELKEIKEGKYKRLFARADVMVLDWSLAKDEGTTTRALIRELIQDPAGKLSRLRLICIYTNSPDLAKVREQLASDLNGLAVEYELPEYGADSGLVVEARNFRIAILGKFGVSRLPQFLSSEVALEDLPDRIVKEFAQAVHGLMPGLALNSLAILRDNAPLLLQRFSNSLDPAFVSHELLTGQGRRFAVQLIAREIQSILEAADAGSVLSLDNIKSWAMAKLDADSHDSPKVIVGSVRQFVKDDVTDALSQHDFSANTLRDLPPVKGTAKIGKAKLATLSTLFVDETDALGSEEKLGRLSCLSRDLHSGYTGARLPTLQLGTILARLDTYQIESPNDPVFKYWLCLQALCDSERIREPRGFPLIPLRQAQNGDDFDLLVMDHQNTKRAFSGSARPFEMKVIEFPPNDPDGVVRASGDGINLTFKDSDGNDWNWVAELRAEHALRMSHSVATAISRIGLDESEWLRLSGNNKKP